MLEQILEWGLTVVEANVDRDQVGTMRPSFPFYIRRCEPSLIVECLARTSSSITGLSSYRRALFVKF